MSCNTKDIYIKYQIELGKNKQKDKEIEIIKKQKDELLKQKDELLKQKDDDILYLKNQIDKIQPNNQTNNQIYNNCNFVYVNINCPNDITTALPNLTIEHEMQGRYGIGLFLMDYVLKGKILIHDISRKLMSYMLNDEIVKDNGTKIILKVLNPIDKEINKRMFKNKYNEIQKDMILMHIGDVPLIMNKYQGFDETDVFNGIQEAMFKNGEKKKININFNGW
jgi:hypothetical protein